MVASDDSIKYVKWSQLEALKKLKAKSPIYAGTVVVGQMFGEKAQVPEGKASVGLALKEGQYYAGIKSGDTVAAYRVGSSGSSGSDSSDKGSSSSSSGNGFIANASVERVKGDSDATVSTGSTSITLLVDEGDAAALASASSAGEVALVRIPAK
jgi:hypothetical protein